MTDTTQVILCGVVISFLVYVHVLYTIVICVISTAMILIKGTSGTHYSECADMYFADNPVVLFLGSNGNTMTYNT